VEGGKSAPEEIIRQLWVHKLIHQYGYLIPVIKLMWSGHDHQEAFRLVAQKLDVRYNTVSSQCTRGLGLTTDDFIKRVESKTIVDLIEYKFPDRYQKIKSELKR
jgi:acyl carrier protein phosphodiesterase